ncbi:MAG TPA: hypothetical protein VK765_05895 [Solirubrobacteraceae bacterium]|jgi:hypothetical protein|nr:hypothetical protein [Solirubrobacteraceae bacterium]
MPRIIVITDPLSAEPGENPSVLLEEHVHSVHLSTDHAASQLVQRLAWAVSDAENAERTPARETPSRLPRAAARHSRQATQARRRQTVAA